jgi:hypothetical protein
VNDEVRRDPCNDWVNQHRPASLKHTTVISTIHGDLAELVEGTFLLRKHRG